MIDILTVVGGIFVFSCLGYFAFFAIKQIIRIARILSTPSCLGCVHYDIGYLLYHDVKEDCLVLIPEELRKYNASRLLGARRSIDIRGTKYCKFEPRTK